ncbi:GGDEF domain-containing protein [Methylomagnum sp.]
MANSRTLSVAWAVSESRFPQADVTQAMESLGLHLQPLDIRQPVSGQFDLAVLHSACFGDLEQLRHFHNELSVPSLIVADSEAEENQIFQWPTLPLSVDVCRAESLNDQLAPRLRRLTEATGQVIGWHLKNGASRGMSKALHNREYLELRLARELSNAQKYCRSLSIAWLELADLSRIGKTFGAAAADRALQAFTESAVDNIRIVDWLAHYGDGEFCLVMPDTWLNEARQVAQRLKKNLSLLQVQVDGQHVLTPRMNIGVAELSDAEESHGDLMQKAAEAALMDMMGA